MDKVALLKHTILYIRDRIGTENALIRDLKSMIEDLECGKEVPEDVDATVRKICRYINVKYTDVRKAAEGGDNDWESLFKEET